MGVGGWCVGVGGGVVGGVWVWVGSGGWVWVGEWVGKKCILVLRGMPSVCVCVCMCVRAWCMFIITLALEAQTSQVSHLWVISRPHAWTLTQLQFSLQFNASR